MANERNPGEQPVLTVEECASVDHPLTVDVLGESCGQIRSTARPAACW